MNTLSRFLLCAAGIAMLAAFGVVITHEQAAFGRAEVEHTELFSHQQQIEQLKNENQELESLRAVNLQVQDLEKSNRDLPKLRNDIRRFREQTAEAARLKAENERLTSTLKTTSTAVAGSDFISRSTLVDAGLATPEATAETMFNALVHGDLRRMSECRGIAWSLEGASQTSLEAQAKESQNMIEQNSGFTGYRIANRKDISPQQVEIDVQGSANGALMPLNLVLRNNQWIVQ